jgi:hypothetical protein
MKGGGVIEVEKDEEGKEEDLGYYGHIMKKKVVELTAEDKLEIEEESRQNKESVAFKVAQAKEIISPHSFSILANKEPKPELADPVIVKAREVFQTEKEGKDLDTLPRKKIVPMLVAMGYNFDNNIMETIIDKITQKEEFDEDEWCMVLEEYQAPAYYYGQILRKYCGRDEIDKVEELVVRGCDVNTGDGEGLTPLHYASELNQVRIIQSLSTLSNGHLNVNAQDKYGWTPLHSASHQGNTDVVQALLKLNADATITDKYGKTPLHYAAAQVTN